MHYHFHKNHFRDTFDLTCSDLRAQSSHQNLILLLKKIQFNHLKKKSVKNIKLEGQLVILITSIFEILCFLKWWT